MSELNINLFVGCRGIKHAWLFEREDQPVILRLPSARRFRRDHDAETRGPA